MNPHRINIHVKGYNVRVKREFELFNVEAYLQGEYFCEAIAATVVNMFGGKNSYPNEPYKFGESSELSEEDIQKQRDLFVANYLRMQANFNLAKDKSGQAE